MTRLDPLAVANLPISTYPEPTMRNLQWRWMMADTFAWLVGAALASEIRFELTASPFVLSRYLAVGITCALTQILIGMIIGQYRGRFRSGTFDDFKRLPDHRRQRSPSDNRCVLLAQPSSVPANGDLKWIVCARDHVGRPRDSPETSGSALRAP